MSKTKLSPARVLHIARDFGTSAQTDRVVTVASKIAPRAHHSFVCASHSDFSGLADLPRTSKRHDVADFPKLGGLPLPGRLQKIAKAMRPFDLVLTYGRTALDAAMAHTLFSQALGLPPLIHHEDETEFFAEDEGLAKTWYRRLAFGRSSGLVVPSERLEEIALVDWQQPLGRVKRIPPAVDVGAFAKTPNPDAIPRLLKRPGEKWVGSFARFAEGEAFGAAVEAFKALPDNWHLVLCGDGPRRETVEALVDRLEQNHRVHFVSRELDPAVIVGLFDIYLHTDPHRSGWVVQAMAAARPIVAPEPVAATLVAEANADFLLGSLDTRAFETELVSLALDEKLRSEVGKANRAQARSAFDIPKMFATYRRLFTSAMARGF